MEYDLKNEKLLMIHMDDMGMSYAANRAGIELFEKGIANSASILMPGSWANDFVKWSKSHPEYDVGVHSALTCEWEVCRWRSLCAASEVPGLMDIDGFMPKSGAEVFEKSNIKEYEKEIRMQIEQAVKWGLGPTHLDNHMWVAAASGDFFRKYIDLAREYGLIPKIPEWSLFNDEMISIYNQYSLPMVKDVSVGISTNYDEKKEAIYEALRLIPTGFNVLTLHPVIDVPEIREIIPEWRNRYYEYRLMMEDETREIIMQLGIRMVTWKDIMDDMKRK